MKKTKKLKKNKGPLAVILILALVLCLLPAGQTVPIQAYTAAQRTSLKAADLAVSRERLLKSAAAHVKRANQVGYGYNRVLNGTSYIPLATSNQGFCCVDLVTHVVYTATASIIGGAYHSLEESLASSHPYADSTGLVFNTQTVSTLKSQLQGIPALYSPLGAEVSPSLLMLGDIVLMGDKDSPALNHSVMVLGKITVAENAYMNIPGFSAATSYFVNMSSATGATYQSTDRLNKAWSSGDPNKGYFIKAVYRPRFPIKEQDLGGFRLKKTDGAGAGLAGAEFLLTCPDGSTRRIVMTEPVYESGKVYRPGTYLLKETKALPGFLLDPVERILTIGMDEVDSHYWDDPVVNERARGQIEVVKENDRGRPVPGAVFRLEDDRGGLVTTLTTDREGRAVTGPLALGSYRLTEVEVPPPYVLDPLPRTVTLSYQDQQTPLVLVTIPWINQEARGRIRLKKYDSVSGRPLEGVVFEIRDQEGTRVAFLVTDYQGMAVSEDLALGSYQLHERETKEGYCIQEQAWTVTLDYQGQEVALFTQDVELANDPIRGRIQVIKTDKADGSPVEGAVFELLDREGKPALDYLGGTVARLVTDQDGQALTPELRQGAYLLRELEAPPHYYLDPQDYPAMIRQDGKTEVVEIQNERVMVYIQLKKFDSQSLLPLAGARFQILGKGVGRSFEVLEELVTDDRGRARSSRPLPAGDYRLLEVQPPPGYSSGRDQDFHISRETGSIMLEGGYRALDLQAGNQPVRLEFSKKSTMGEEELPGAHLQLIDPETGGILDEWVSGEEPHPVSCLSAGKTYCLREIEAPPGYALCHDILFTVEDTESVQTVEMRDDPALIIRKLDELSGRGLAGAVLELFNEGGELVRSGQTDEEGRLVLTGLPPGNYQAREAKAPPGYERSDRVLKISIDARGKGQGDLVLKNRPEGLPPTGEFPLAYVLGPLLVALAGGMVLFTLALRRRKRSS